ncbi:uncharacterized protein LOC131681603 [Topomyia yanbarensis]|uniref:uncharacterized protein LOC131681603 n=1 Tax=Topomyia yanbarensis TaxID=2498891 RepID=UPI00273ADC56|nr:uncharacterized protein LOC131681603 [Topomyia yanbarensis]
MGKRNKQKTALNASGDDSVASKQVLEQPAPSVENDQVESDRFEIPLHSKQAAFALLWLLVYSFGMFTLPFLAFYGTRYILTHNFHVEGFANTCGSVLAAVLMVNVIIVLYAIRGFQEAAEDEREAKSEQTEQKEAKEESKKSK